MVERDRANPIVHVLRDAFARCRRRTGSVSSRIRRSSLAQSLAYKPQLGSSEPRIGVLGNAHNQSVRTSGTVWSIRNLLVAAVALLAVFGIGISGHVLRNASLERATASDAASVNETADMLLESAGQWARERGATNLALNAAEPATDAQKATIANFRKLGDQPFEQALVRMAARHFANKDQLIAGAKRAHEQLAAIRARADAEMAKPASARDQTVVSQWAPTITGLIAASQNLRVAAAMEEDDIQSRLSSLQNFKHFVWIMSEYLGRERAAVAALVASGKPMSSQEISNLAAFRGRLEVAWEYVQAYAAKSSAPSNVVGRHRARARERVPAVRGNPQRRICCGTRRRQLSHQFCRMVWSGDKGDRRRDRAQRDREPGSGETGRIRPAQQSEYLAGECGPDGFLVSSCGRRALDRLQSHRSIDRTDDGSHERDR